MFPPQIPNVFIRWLTDAGDAIYDPFAGRGTVPLEAVLAGRRAFGSDASPLAVALTGPKVKVASHDAAHRRLDALEARYTPQPTTDVPADIRMLYARRTLSQLVYLRTALERTRVDDALLTATLLGVLHGNHSSEGATRSLSISMPNTFAMSPNYVRSYIDAHQLKAPAVDVFAMLRKRLEQLALPRFDVDGGEAWTQDAMKPSPQWLRQRKVKMVFTSPPYLEVIKYGKYNWIRMWFLGEDPKQVDAELTATSSLPRYREFIGRSLENLRDVVREDGFVCLVIGDVRRDEAHLNLAADVWLNVAEPQGWKLHGIIVDRLPAGGKVSRIWKQAPGRATKIDRILVLSPQDRDLPSLGRVSWERRSDWPVSLTPKGI